MTDTLTIRPIAEADRAAWEPLWAGYNAFYERAGPTALAPAITQVLWTRLFDPDEPVFALVAEQSGRLAGLAHFLFLAAPPASSRCATCRTCSPIPRCADAAWDAR